MAAMSARSAHLMRERRHGAEPRPAVVATGVRRSVLGTLNNPLASILGYAELVEESLPEGDPRRSDLATIRAETQRARTVVRRLAELGQSTPDGGGRVDPGVVVRDPRGPPRAGGRPTPDR